MTAAASILRGAMASAFPMFSGAVTYERNNVPISDALPAAVRDFRGETLFGSAEVGDRLAVIWASDFAALGIGDPQKYDAVIMADGRFTVHDWRVNPPVGTPVFYRLAIRGGSK